MTVFCYNHMPSLNTYSSSFILQTLIQCISGHKGNIYFMSNDICTLLFPGISALFAVKMFKAWIAEKDANSVTSSLRKANLDKRLLVRTNPDPPGNTARALQECGMVCHTSLGIALDSNHRCSIRKDTSENTVISLYTCAKKIIVKI